MSITEAPPAEAPATTTPATPQTDEPAIAPNPFAPSSEPRRQAVSDFTRDLLLRVRDLILEELQRLRMSVWVYPLDVCGTGARAGTSRCKPR